MPIQSIGWAIIVEVAGLDGVGERPVGVEQVVGVRAAQQGVEPPPVVDRVDEAHLVVRRRRVALAADVRRVDHDAELRGRRARRASPARASPWASSSWWATVTAAFGSVRPGAWYAGGVAEVGVAPRLVERRPHRHLVAELARHQRGVVAEPAHGVAAAEAADVLERLGEVPVEQRRARLDAVVEQQLDEPVVERRARRR